MKVLLNFDIKIVSILNFLYKNKYHSGVDKPETMPENLHSTN